MAEQQKPIRRKVALKVLKPGMDTRQVIARYEAERMGTRICAIFALRAEEKASSSADFRLIGSRSPIDSQSIRRCRQQWPFRRVLEFRWYCAVRKWIMPLRVATSEPG
jgi:hypothetical protein